MRVSVCVCVCVCGHHLSVSVTITPFQLTKFFIVSEPVGPQPTKHTLASSSFICPCSPQMRSCLSKRRRLFSADCSFDCGDMSPLDRACVSRRGEKGRWEGQRVSKGWRRTPLHCACVCCVSVVCVLREILSLSLSLSDTRVDTLEDLIEGG